MKLGDLRIGVEYAVLLERGADNTFGLLVGDPDFGAPGWNDDRSGNDRVRRLRLSAMRVPVTDPVTGTPITSGLQLTDPDGSTVAAHARYVVEPWERFQRRLDDAQARVQRRYAPLERAAEQLGMKLSYSTHVHREMQFDLTGLTRPDLAACAALGSQPGHRTAPDEVDALLELVDHLRRGEDLRWSDDAAARESRESMLSARAYAVVGSNVQITLDDEPWSIRQLDEADVQRLLSAIGAQRGLTLTLDGLGELLRDALEGDAEQRDAYRTALAERLARRARTDRVVLTEIPPAARQWPVMRASYEVRLFGAQVARLELDVADRRWTLHHRGELSCDLRTPGTETIVDLSDADADLDTLRSLIAAPVNEIEELVLDRAADQVRARER